MHEYICYTKQGKWKFYADNDIDSLRLALFYCWRDGEDFIKVESVSLGSSPSGASLAKNPYTLRLCMIDKTNSIQTL